MTSQQVVVVNAVVFLAVFAYVLCRQLTVRAVSPRTFVLVAILFLYGLSGGFPTATPGVALFGVSLVVSVVFGVWRGTSMRMSPPPEPGRGLMPEPIAAPVAGFAPESSADASALPSTTRQP